MKPVRLLTLVFALVGLTVLAGCGHRTKRSLGPVVGGSVVYVTNVQLPADATIEIQLVELSRNGEVVRVICGETLPRPPKVPAPFDLPYEKREIHRRTAYGLKARILSGGDAIFVSPRPTPVLTLGNPKRAEVVVEPVRKK